MNLVVFHVPGVLMVPSVLKVLGVPGVLMVPGIPSVLKVPGVPGMTICKSLILMYCKFISFLACCFIGLFALFEVDATFGYLEYSTYNIGDDIQSIAAQRLLPKTAIPIDRDFIHQFQSDEITHTLMNAWFMHTKNYFTGKICKSCYLSNQS